MKYSNFRIEAEVPKKNSYLKGLLDTTFVSYTATPDRPFDFLLPPSLRPKSVEKRAFSKGGTRVFWQDLDTGAQLEFKERQWIVAQIDKLQIQKDERESRKEALQLLADHFNQVVESDYDKEVQRFDAWWNEVESFATRGERLGDLTPRDLAWSAWSEAKGLHENGGEKEG